MKKGEDKYLWKIDRFNGGLSEDSRIGYKGAFRSGEGNDIRYDSGLLTVSKKTTKDSDTTVDALVKWIEPHPTNGDIYMYMATKIIKRASNGTYSTARTIGSDSPNGQGLCDFNGYLYYRSETRLGRFDYSSTWTDNWQTGLTAITDFSPMCRFKNFLLGGHGRYVFSVDDTGTYTAQKLTFPPGYKVRDIFTVGSLAVFLCIRGSVITDSDEGMMFFWDGNTPTYTDFIPLCGNPHAGIAVNNKLVIIAGDQPSIQESLGGVADIKMSIPKVLDGVTAEVYPGALDLWRNMAHFGISDGTSTAVPRVVYNWGAKNVKFDDVLNSEFPISTGTKTGTGVQISAVKKVGTTLYIAWKDGASYGVDKIDTSSYLASAVYRTLAFDRESPYEKIPDKVLIELAGALATDESITVKVSADPYGDPLFTDTSNIAYKQVTYATDGAVKIIEMPLIAAANSSGSAVHIRSRDLHLEVTRAGSGSTRPSIKRIWTEFNEDPDII